MKIAKIECIPLAIPFHYRPLGEPGTFRLYNQPWDKYNVLLVRVETDTGIVGWGETFSLKIWRSVIAAMRDTVIPVAIGRDAANINKLMFDLHHLLGMVAGYSAMAQSGLDIALWDIAGKAAGLPLYRLLGASGATPLIAYQSLFFSEDADAVAQVVRTSVEQGFRHIKLHSLDERCVRAARDAAGNDVALMADINLRWMPDEARIKAERFKQYNLYWLEEPLFPATNYAAIAQLQREVGIPIAAGENAFYLSDFQLMFQSGAPKYLQPDVACIGITEFRKVSALASAHGHEVTPHNVMFGPSHLATLHVMAAEPSPGLVERFLVHLEAFPHSERFSVPDGNRWVLPDGPGLGFDPDPDVIREYRIKESDWW